MAGNKGNKILSYQKLVEDINVKLNDAVRANNDAERMMSETLKKLDADAQAQRKHAADLLESAQNDYRRVAESLTSGPYAEINVRIPSAVRPVSSDVDSQTLAAKQHNLIVQIRSLAETYIRQKAEEDEARRRQAEAEAAAAARARAAAAAALARRRALLNQPKPEPPKKKPNIALIIGIVVGVVAVIGIVAAVMLL